MEHTKPHHKDFRYFDTREECIEGSKESIEKALRHWYGFPMKYETFEPHLTGRQPGATDRTPEHSPKWTAVGVQGLWLMTITQPCQFAVEGEGDRKCWGFWFLSDHNTYQDRL